MKYKYIFFDLDGTIIDSAPGIVASTRHALKRFGIEEADLTTLHQFIGPPLTDSFRKYYGFTPEQAVKAIESYREYYTDGGMLQCEPYPGVEALLREIAAAGGKILLATSKPEIYAQRILEHFHLDRYFFCVAGSSLDERRVHKDEILVYAIKKCGIQDPASAVMVGDREYDVLGAQKVGIPCIGVLYGYGSEEELSAAGACALARTPAEVWRFL